MESKSTDKLIGYYLILWILQTAILNYALFGILNDETKKNLYNLGYALVNLDLIFFLGLILLVLISLLNSTSLAGRILIILGSIIFMFGAISYRVLINWIPNISIFNVLSKLLYPNSPKIQNLGFSVINEIIRAVFIANVGLLLVAIGLVLLSSRRRTKIMFLLYGIINLSLSFSLLVFLKPIISLVFLIPGVLFFIQDQKLYDEIEIYEVEGNK